MTWSVFLSFRVVETKLTFLTVVSSTLAPVYGSIELSVVFLQGELPFDRHSCKRTNKEKRWCRYRSFLKTFLFYYSTSFIGVSFHILFISSVAVIIRSRNWECIHCRRVSFPDRFVTIVLYSYYWKNCWRKRI